MPFSTVDADRLLAAVQGVRPLRGRTVVVKLGGSAMEDAVALASTLDDLAALHALGVCVAVVHGGGKAIDRAMTASGLAPRKIDGRRVTDAATLAVVGDVLAGLARRIAAELSDRGASAWAVGDPPREVALIGERQQFGGVDLGWVGTVERLSAEVGRMVASGSIPVLPSLAQSADGQLLNVNADTAAAAVARGLAADRLVFLTDTPGILANRNDPTSLVSRLDAAACDRMVSDGSLDGGMLPKIEACFDALRAGVGSVRIIDGRKPRALLLELLGDEPTGTELTA